MNESASSQKSNYSYDVYISYRRANQWPSFVTQHFLPIFEHWLGAELGYPPQVFCDNDIEVDGPWPLRFATSLAASKIMVCLWSGQYFSSPWCSAELASMLARRELIKRVSEPPPQLIFAAIIHGNPPSELHNIEAIDIRNFSNPWMAPNSLMAERLSNSILKLSVSVARAIERVPHYDPSWGSLPSVKSKDVFSSGQKHDSAPSL